MVDRIKRTGLRKSKGEAQKALESAFATAFSVLKLVMYGVVIAILVMGAFQVGNNEKAVVVRFGKVKAVYGPGLHFAFPYPIDEVKRVPVNEVKTVVLDKVFWHPGTEGRALPLRPSLTSGYTLTNDANIIHSRWELRYTINDPVKYLFDINDPEALLTNSLNNAIVEASAEFTVDEAMKTALEEFRDRVELVFRSKLRETGQEDTFRVQRVVRKDVKPPLQTINAFEQVISASQERDSKKSEAKGDADAIHNDAAGAIAKELVAAIDAYQAVIKTGDVDKIAEAEEKVDLLLSKAGGMASEIITQAEAYRSLIVSEAASDAKRMAELRDLYKENPEILFTEKLFELYLELFKERVVYLLSETSAKGGRELRIMVNPDPNIRMKERHEELLEESEQDR